MEVYADDLLENGQTFTNEIQYQKQKWLLGTLPNSGHIDTTNSMIQLYSNLIEYGTWKKDLSETDYIVVLTILVHEIQGTIKINTIDLATKAEEQAKSHPAKKNHFLQEGSYTVDACLLVNNEDTVTVNKKTWYWCTKDHYSGGIMHNAMYALHKTCEHDTWCKYLNESYEKAGHTNSKSSTSSSTTTNLNPVKNITLSEYLCTSLCTQYGISSDVADHIWSDTCRHSGNK